MGMFSSKEEKKSSQWPHSLSNILPCSHGNGVILTKSGGAAKTVWSTQICMDFTEAVRQESLPLQLCSNCGVEYGASSIVFHQKTCRSEKSRKTASERRKRVSKRPSVPAKSTDDARSETKQCVTSLTTLTPPSEAVTGVRVFGSPCKFCGERFGTHSLRLHMKKCQKQNQEPPTCAGEFKPIKIEKKYFPRGTVAPGVSSVWRQSVETVGVHHVQFDLPTSRPRTRSLDHSVLVEKGYTLPNIDNTTSGVSMTKILCKMCGEMVVSEESSIHKQTCRPIPRTITKGEIVFPTQTLKSKMSGPDGRMLQVHSNKAFIQPPTIVCYICGREYGTKSISIHEPQCLKKFNLENRKLPISQRKPLPKKSINRTATLIIPVGLQDHAAKMPTPEMAKTEGVYKNDVLQDTADQYFQYCYSEWEMGLVTCKTCGRKFAPERHRKHAHRCKAKPLPNIRHNLS